MKRISTVIVILLAVLAASPLAQAQEGNDYDYAHKKGLSISVNGAAVLTGIVTQPSWGQANYNHQMKIGSSFGIDLGYQFARHFSITAGVAMQNLGSKLNNKSFYLDELNKPMNVDRTIDMQYLSIPVMFHYVDNRRTFNFIGGIGAAYSMISSADQTWTVKNNTTGVTTDYSAMVEVDGKMVEVAEKDVKDRFESADIMLNFEAGVRMMATKKINIDLLTTYAWSLNSSTKSEWNDIPNFQPKDYLSEKPRNIYGGFKVSVAYKFGGKKEDR